MAVETHAEPRGGLPPDPAGARPGPEVADRRDVDGGLLLPGTRVEVRCRFTGAWASGFEVAAPDAGGYRLRRLSDGAVLPVQFAEPDVQPDHRRSGSSWC